MSISYADLETLVFSVSSSSLSLTVFLPPFPQVFLSSDGQIWRRHLSFRAGCSNVSNSLHNVWPWVSLFSSAAGRHIKLMMAEKGTTLWVKHNVTNRYFIPTLKKKTDFTPCLCVIWSQILGYQSGARFHLISRVLNLILLGYYHRLSVTIALVHLEIRKTLYFK